MQNFIFSPSGNTVNIAAADSAASQRVALGTLDLAGSPTARFRTVRVVNSSTSVIMIKFGDVTVVAVAANDVPVAPGATEVFLISYDVTYVAAITAAGTANAAIYFSAGTGS